MTQAKKKEQASNASGATRLPLSALLSQALVAFTIEFDNEAERRMQHRTTNHGATAGASHAPWLVSMAMWLNCMQFVGEQGITVGELERVARTETNLNGMERWGYVLVGPNPADIGKKPRRADWLIRATSAGRKAQEVWRPLFGAIEKRWEERFGEEGIGQLRKSLLVLSGQFETDLPECMPILGYGLFSQGPERGTEAGRETGGHDLPLVALLAQVLLAFALEFEGESSLSLAVSANVVRVLDETGIRVGDLPRISGISKELIKVALGFLQKNGCVVIASDPASKGTKLARLTNKGMIAQNEYHRLVDAIEERWQRRFGEDTIRGLRKLLEPLVGEGTFQGSPLSRGVEPHPENWRAKVARPDTLPYYPMVTHRGGFPDGS